jgi:hypothetical protein
VAGDPDVTLVRSSSGKGQGSKATTRSQARPVGPCRSASPIALRKGSRRADRERPGAIAELDEDEALRRCLAITVLDELEGTPVNDQNAGGAKISSGHQSHESGDPWKKKIGGPSRSPHSVNARARPSRSRMRSSLIGWPTAAFTPASIAPADPRGSVAPDR